MNDVWIVNWLNDNRYFKVKKVGAIYSKVIVFISV